MKLTPLRVLAVLSLLTFPIGCSKKDAPAPSEAKETPPLEKAAEPTAVTETQPQTTSVDLPPLSTAIAPESARKTADAKNAEALTAQRAGDFPKAIALYAEALAADPNHILARYNLATAYSLAGNRDAATKLLGDFAAAKDCAVCQGRLVRAQEDEDFKSLWEDAEFKKLTATAKVEMLSPKDASANLIAALTNLKKSEAAGGDISDLKSAVIHPRNAIDFVSVNGNCDAEEGSDDCTSTSKLVGAMAVSEALDDGPLLTPKVGTCTDSCCTFSTDDAGSDSAILIEKLCFSTDSGNVTTLTSMQVIDGA